MRNIAFGYSTRCNIKCDHCVAAGEEPTTSKMELQQAKRTINELAEAGITGISFTAGEPTLYLGDILELLSLCKFHNIFTRVVTNSSWAKDTDSTLSHLKALQLSGLNQLRLSYSRWHQEHVPKENILNAAHGCIKYGINYFISFVTDFSEQDETYERFLRENTLNFFPEPLIYSGRAKNYLKEKLFTDYQDNRCAMNLYLAPDYNLYACCDAGSHFTKTNAFFLGNLQRDSATDLFSKSDQNPLFNCIRNLGLSTIASYTGMPSREIITYRKCELCEKLINDPETFIALKNQAPFMLQNLSR
jgi:MoaA/NifB/PqqE/SkfB family radical SAM enzyme